jgi:hypothetical protein
MIELLGGPTHRFGPEGFPAGEMAKQGSVADPHPLGDRRRADPIGGGGAGEVEQGPHGMGPSLWGGDGGGPGHGRGGSVRGTGTQRVSESSR